ncbi:hypothetical protein PIB30_009434 [Stylosanthes scabra]|uniref:Uncharacterized protein n=1 Tax=Stylosanthes scabra TaxID=79078 RepID=A0ABU6X581_9FABA|nr:hypothetical protein [Stylosanthes scabra]
MDGEILCRLKSVMANSITLNPSPPSSKFSEEETEIVDSPQFLLYGMQDNKVVLALLSVLVTFKSLSPFFPLLTLSYLQPVEPHSLAVRVDFSVIFFPQFDIDSSSISAVVEFGLFHADLPPSPFDSTSLELLHAFAIALSITRRLRYQDMLARAKRYTRVVRERLF